MSKVRSVYLWIKSAFEWMDSREKRSRRLFVDYMLSYPTDKDVERKEKIFQMYLILFGFLISYSNDHDDYIASQIMKFFMVFIIAGLFYYISMLHPHTRGQRQFYVPLALIMGVALNFAFFAYYASFYPGDLWDPNHTDFLMSITLICLITGSLL